MAHVDTIFSIKQFYANLYINQPFLEAKGISSPDELLDALPQTGFSKKKDTEPNLRTRIEEAYAVCDDNRRVGRYKKYRDFHSLFLTEGLSGLTDTIPFLIAGESITDTARPRKRGIDPYSPHHLFSQLLLEELHHYPEQFLNDLRFIYLQPVTFVQKPIVKENTVMLQDIMHDKMEHLPVQGIGFGTLEIALGQSSGIGNTFYSSSLLNTDHALKEIENDSINYLSERKAAQMDVLLNQHILAIKYAAITDQIASTVIPRLTAIDLSGYPTYVEKTSSSASIIKRIPSYTDRPFRTHLIGGTPGVLSNTPERLPLSGICHPSALNRLSGFLQTICSHYQPDQAPIFRRYQQQTTKPSIPYKSTEHYPFLLIPDTLDEKGPTIADVYSEMLSTQEQQLIQDFAYLNKIGFTRLEPRLLTLFSSNQIVYDGFRNMDKTNRFWQQEIEGKRIIPAYSLPGFSSLQAIQEKKATLRASLLSLPTNPHIDREWFHEAYQGYLDTGCSIEKLIANSPQKEQVIREFLPYADEALRDDFFAMHLDNLESIPAIRGTAIHTLSSVPFDGLAEYDITAPLGFSVPSDRYAEMPFYFEFPATQSDKPPLSISMHPDGLFFLEKEGIYDILILDTKTNRATPYPEHKYLLQTFTYGWVIKQVLSEELGIETDTIYTVLNKNAFYQNFGQDIKQPSAHARYRPQVFSPITRFDRSHDLHDIMPEFFKTIVDEQEQIQDDYDSAQQYKAQMEQKDLCSKCYSEHRIICDGCAAQSIYSNLFSLL